MCSREEPNLGERSRQRYPAVLDCSAYSTFLPDNIEWTFYGIVGHKVYAVVVFEPAHS